MAACSQIVKYNNKRGQSNNNTSSDISKVLSDIKSDSDSNTNAELDSKDLDSDNSDPNNSFHDKGQLSREEHLAKLFLNKYYQYIGVNPVLHWKLILDSEETVCFLYGLFSWRCDICCGKNKTASGLSKEIQRKVIALVAKEKELELVRKPKKNMYIKDIAKFARVFLTTTEMTFACGCRPGALLHLRYRDIGLKFIRDPQGRRPRLFIYLKPDFTKRFLGKKAPNKFKIPEIIFNPSLTLSPHVYLLSMLFHIQAFKKFSKTGPVLDSPEKLYSLNVPDGLGQQPLPLNNKLLDKFVFCQQMTPAMLGSRLR
ncbi:hypothetical protein BDW74DRAFT_185708 [Aspergillus multicolor]|uniref:uncharacterized protein n=1 Tax=Aspergillus multicolor TaxID=41759 RepID=UPI003CCDB98A